MTKTILIIIVVLIIVAIGSYFLLRGGEEAEISQSAPEPTEEVKEFEIIAKNWEFQPNTITVNQGDTVKLRIRSIDATHGFGLSPESGIDIQNVRLEPGKTVEIEFAANKKGIFMFACTILCGLGHDRMTGQLIVK